MDIPKFIVYIDGANLYSSLQATGKNFSEFHLDFWSFIKRIINKGLQEFFSDPCKKFEFEILKIHYYNAYIKAKKNGDILRKKQQNLFNRLEQRGIDVKIFDRSPKSGKIKGDDVAIAVDLISDAYHMDYNYVLLITRDSDFIPALEKLISLNKKIFLASVGNKIRKELKDSVHHYIQISNTIIRKSSISNKG